MCDPAGMRPFIADFPAVAESLIQGVQRVAVGRIVDDKAKQLMASLLGFPELEAPPVAAGMWAATPVLPIGFIKDGRRLNYFSIVTTVGTPQTVAAQELRIECMSPPTRRPKGCTPFCWAKARHDANLGTKSARAVGASRLADFVLLIDRTNQVLYLTKHKSCE
jgi:hypothetical protein